MISRESDLVLHTLAGPEIGVASTKAFSTQLVVLACFLRWRRPARGAIDAAREAELSAALTECRHVLPRSSTTMPISRKSPSRLPGARDVLFLGRGTSYPIALEGALKLKEISYIHAEGYAAGE